MCCSIESLIYSFHLCHILVTAIDHLKRKIRRRPSWGRGIIRKKKNYKKGTEEEEEEPEAEVEATGPSDSCLTQDEESSCDTMGPQTNGHVPSTEEESSNETPVKAQADHLEVDESGEGPTSKEEESKEDESEDGEKLNQLHGSGDSCHAAADTQADLQPLSEMSTSSDAEAPPKHIEDLQVPRVDCVNGNESLDSMDSQSLKRSHAENVTPQSSNNNLELDEHKDKIMSEPSQEHLLQDGRAAAEMMEEDQDNEGRVQEFEGIFQTLKTMQTPNCR